MSAAGGEPSAADVAAVTELLGRRPGARFTVAVRDRFGVPVVIENGPFLDDGTPMPTRYWLVGRAACEVVSRLEAEGGVRAAEAAIPPAALAAAHARYASGRDELIESSRVGPRPFGGVGGTRRGVKCLHAHLAWYLAGGGDPVGRWVARRLGPALDGPAAAIDCGTNSTRLLIVDALGAPLERLMRITRLGEGVDRTALLSPEAIARTTAVLSEFSAAIDRHGVTVVRAVATSAARDVGNADAFFDAAEEVLGVRPELLAGEEEGRLAYLGATAELEVAEGPYLLVDVGGGSTELVAGHPFPPALSVVSLDVGCVRVTERFLHHDPPEAAELDVARSAIARLLDDALTAVPALAVPRRLVGVAGTVSALSALEQGLERYDRDRVHHAVLTRSAVERLLGELVVLPAAERRQRRGIEPGRADVILGGILVLREVMERLGHGELLVSEADLLDGIVADLIAGRSRRATGGGGA